MAAHHDQELLSEAISVACKMHGFFENDKALVQYLEHDEDMVRLKPLLVAQYKALRQELYMMHAYRIYKGKIPITPPTLPAHASHGGQPTAIGPRQSNDPVVLDKATRKLINMKPLGSTEWHGMCARNCKQARNFISVEAMRQIGLTVESGGQYECAWMLDDDDVVRVGIFQAVSRLGADVVFGLNWFDDCPNPTAATSIDTILDPLNNPSIGLKHSSSTQAKQPALDR